LNPLNRSSRREEALIVLGEFRWSLLTSAATRFMEREDCIPLLPGIDVPGFALPFSSLSATFKS
jgi:hypothetical protein